MTRRLLISWLPLAVAVIIVMVAMYGSVQQTIRMGANDPQVQMAEDGARALASGTPAVMVVGATHVDMSQSLAPFTIVYDDTGKVVASSGYIDGQVPVLPAGVFDYTRTAIDDRITWQPASTTRIAAVVKHYGGAHPGFIVAGRNMREIEDRENQIELIDLAALVALLALTLIISVYSQIIEMRRIGTSM